MLDSAATLPLERQSTAPTNATFVSLFNFAPHFRLLRTGDRARRTCRPSVMAAVATRMAQPIRTVHPEKMALEQDAASRAFTNSLQAAKPLTLKSLLEEPVEFVDSRRKTDDDAIPYTPINVKVRASAQHPRSWTVSADTRLLSSHLRNVHSRRRPSQALRSMAPAPASTDLPSPRHPNCRPPRKAPLPPHGACSRSSTPRCRGRDRTGSEPACAILATRASSTRRCKSSSTRHRSFATSNRTSMETRRVVSLTMVSWQWAEADRNLMSPKQVRSCNEKAFA